MVPAVVTGKMTLAATKFLRRFFLHVLPREFVRIRHFGFLAACWRILHAQWRVLHIEALAEHLD